jgi:3-hydroxymyristoyl/3-hydroxydecanoyl-(acyl carrier protein) dehydratase
VPEFRELVRVGDTLTATFDVPLDLAIFAGHFPWVPIVPGAVLVGWCADLAAREGLWRHGARRISSVKFRQIVQPGPGYRLRLALAEGGMRLDLRIESDRAMHASGTLLAPAS